MFKSIVKIKSSNGNSSSGRDVSSLEKDEPKADEDLGDPDYWQVIKLPTNDLDELMWGSVGKPPPPPAPARMEEPSKCLKKWADGSESDDKGEGSSEHNVAESNECAGEEEDATGEAAEEQQQHNENDNILAALSIENAIKEQDAEDAAAAFEPEPDDKIILEDIVWKQRSGFGKYSLGLIKHEWEQRRVVLFESGMLRYYKLKGNMEGVKYDPEHAVDPDKSPWVYDVEQEARGEMDLRARDGKVGSDDDGSDDGSDRGESGRSRSSSSSFGEGMQRLRSFRHGGGELNVGGVGVRARERRSDPGPTPYEIDITRKDNDEMWRFCFQSQSIQMEWLDMLKRIASNDGEIGSDDDDDDDDDAKYGLDKRGFQPGDHIIRWEMLPILYPIQVHGIVLEAGKNCVIIADFGLASHNTRRAVDPELTTLSEEGNKKDDSNGDNPNSSRSDHDVIMAAWEKIKPKEKKRLNVVVVTDPKEVRKWSKVNYGDQVEDKKKKKKKPGFLKSLMPWDKKSSKKKVVGEEGKVDEAVDESEEGAEENESEGRSAEGTNDDADNDANEATAAAEENDGRTMQQQQSSLDEQQSNNRIEGAPEWIQPGYRPRKRTWSSSSTIPLNDTGQSVFSIDHYHLDDDHGNKRELPKSDSAKLVLARTHFILENEDLLPPYHVFYSNSECIAVWCKTGRWSTLQAAVYLVSSSVGFGKSATMLSISVAAAHAILLPAVALGGLAIVGGPLLFLKKSQDKWDKATMRLTEEFWSRATPDVFVEAVEYWAKLGKS